jgi:hypothetical protein
MHIIITTPNILSSLNMKYFKSECGKLIQFNPETKVYKKRNNIEKIDTRISEENFLTLTTKQIKMNVTIIIVLLFVKMWF